MTVKPRRTLDEILASTSDVLFPDQLGNARVDIDSRDVQGDTPLHVMVWREDVHAVGVLVDAGAKIDAVGDMGQTPLHVAVMRENAAIAERLLEAGADPDIRSEFGDTPRELAHEKGGSLKKLFERPARGGRKG